jgi:hypothetical protein
VLLVLLGGGPLHAWLHEHAAGGASSDRAQVHGGDCEHQPDGAAHDPACALCGAVRASTAAPPRVALACGVGQGVRPFPVRDVRAAGCVPVGVLGARGPPVRG